MNRQQFVESSVVTRGMVGDYAMFDTQYELNELIAVMDGLAWSKSEGQCGLDWIENKYNPIEIDMFYCQAAKLKPGQRKAMSKLHYDYRTESERVQMTNIRGQINWQGE